MDETLIKNISYDDKPVTRSCGAQTDMECECPANKYFLKYQDELNEYLKKIHGSGTGTDVQDFEEEDMKPNYEIEIIKEETTIDIHGDTTETTVDITQSLIDLCKDIKPSRDSRSYSRTSQYDAIKKDLAEVVEKAMEYSDNRIDTCSCVLRDDSEAYICAMKKDETETVCVAILTGQRSTCSSSIDEKQFADRASQDTICVCSRSDGDEEEQEPEAIPIEQVEEVEEEENPLSDLEFVGEEEEIRMTAEEWKSESMKIAEEYLRNHRIKEFFDYMVSSLLVHTPDNPIQYLINLLDRCILYRQKQIGPPLLFSKKHIESLFDSMDPMHYGYISIEQYKTGMFTLGLKFYNPYPVVDENNNITKEVFVMEAIKCMQLCFDEMIKIRKLYNLPAHVSNTFSTDSSDTCHCNVSLIS